MVAGLAAAALAGSAWLSFSMAEQRALVELREASNHRLDLFAMAVEGVIRRLESIPPTVQLNPTVLALLRVPHDPGAAARTASHFLERLNAHLGSMAVFVANPKGVVLASSNSRQADDSRRGADISFRPYFLEALAGRVGRHFALGIDGGEPGYFVAFPIHDGAEVVGVATVKIDLSPINEAWALLGVPALLADLNQVVMLSSNPDWRYSALVPLTLERRVDLQLTRLYDEHRIKPFPLEVNLSVDQDSQVIEGQLPMAQQAGLDSNGGMLVLGRTLNGMDWRLITFSSLDGVRAVALQSAAVSTLACALLVLGLLYLAQRRRIQRQRRESQNLLEQVNAELERKVQSRTQDLTRANLQLTHEIGERELAERDLRAAQSELVHAAKMALLGQLATSITHELTQPLVAMETLSNNSVEFLRRGDHLTLESNLGILARLAQKMGSIITPLKSFARKSQPQCSPVDAAMALSNSVFLYGTRLRQEAIEIHNSVAPGACTLWCDPNRLEQVLTNLIGNAIDAMAGSPVRRLELSAGLGHGLDRGPGPDLPAADPEGRAWIAVCDTGPGLGPDPGRVFEPFHTTKPSGAGLGLGLTISRDIVHAFGGEIHAFDRPGGGACFVIDLPAFAPARSVS